LLIDPPFERADDYQRTAESVAEVLRAKPGAVLLIWLPLKDLETLDGFVRRLEAIAPKPRAVISETRIRPLADPMRMNGCVLVAVGAPKGFDAELEAISQAVVETLGEPGGRTKLWRVDG
jgi:23S rRNA (adenine2030-N6)-methyltransferase